MVENESLYIKGTFFANKVFLCFNDDVILQLGNDFFTLDDFFHGTYMRSNLFKEWEGDTNQVRSEFGLKMSIDQFYEINHIYQTVHCNELKFYVVILDTWNYILLNLQVKWSSRTYY